MFLNYKLEKDFERVYLNFLKFHGYYTSTRLSGRSAGIPDRFVIKDGLTFFLEFKRDKNQKLRGEQELFRRTIEEYGVLSFKAEPNMSEAIYSTMESMVQMHGLSKGSSDGKHKSHWSSAGHTQN